MAGLRPRSPTTRRWPLRVRSPWRTCSRCWRRMRPLLHGCSAMKKASYGSSATIEQLPTYCPLPPMSCRQPYRRSDSRLIRRALRAWRTSRASRRRKRLSSISNCLNWPNRCWMEWTISSLCRMVRSPACRSACWSLRRRRRRLPTLPDIAMYHGWPNAMR